MIAAVGQADLNPGALKLVEVELGPVLERMPGRMPVVVRAVAGAPVAVGRAVRAAGRELVVVTPAPEMSPSMPPTDEQEAVGELLCLAGQVRPLEYDAAVRDACVGADERIIAKCRRLLAVWDGSPSNGRDATAHLVAYARARGIPVEVLWPEGAVRQAISGTPRTPSRLPIA
ncbi:hypothetical protein [Streptomyces sp. NPDC057280]|uniref:hypothetical protein n=1 Tax=Streptomyces sp. NPDC057280 TaxID=3346081 RepID=UPI0009A36AA5|nr:hypothetical protein B1R27_23195 [Streptomyces sp. GKU 895]